MLSKRNIRAIMLYELKCGTNVAKTTKRINESFGENLVNFYTVQEWFNKFKKGNENLEDEEHERDENVLENDKLRQTVGSNSRTTVKNFSEDINVSESTIFFISKT
uniref:HTH_48 domain-containing protein n=1 Tax=Strongyloides papillosus TaxID=174720 RepID=A0A0N5BGL4_STREA